jgi:hypothetical protein
VTSKLRFRSCRFSQAAWLRAVLFVALVASPLTGQAAPSVGFLDVGSERERYLRLQQLLGEISFYPWSIRGLGPTDLHHVDSIGRSATTWSRRDDLALGTWRGMRWAVLPVQVPVAFNSAFPYGFNDGPIWAGKGLTVAVQGGFAAQVGPLSVQFEPMAFDARNDGFTSRSTGIPGNGAFANAYYPSFIDVPERFGSRHYASFSAGQSTVRVDIGPLAVAFSTANQFWGPALENPIILGNNAAGFPHAFLGTAHPVSVFIGRIYTRVVWGQLDQTPYAPVIPGSRRLMAGVVGVFMPRGIDGLELGATRFSHSPWPDNGISGVSLLKPFKGVGVPASATGDSARGDNQLGSLFFRWALPGTGAEVYGEYGRDDHWIDLRDIWLEPDHSAAYLLGLQRVWRQKSTGLLVIRGEFLNTRIPALVQSRGEAPWYAHTVMRQGHTERGQLLGSPGGLGGGAAFLAVDRYTASQRWTLRWGRLMRSESRLDSTLVNQFSTEIPDPPRADVMYTLGLEHVRPVPRGLITVGVNGVWDLNRDFLHDQFNLNVVFGFTAVGNRGKR